MYSADFPQFAAACAILLSVVIRWIRSGASWDAVDEGRATADVLRDLTGILDFDSLQETFGPPRLEDGIFPVTRREVLRQRTGLGYLFGDRWLDGGSAVDRDPRSAADLADLGIADVAGYPSDLRQHLSGRGLGRSVQAGQALMLRRKFVIQRATSALSCG